MAFCAARYEILIWKYLEVCYLSLNHAMSIIHTIGKLPFVPGSEKRALKYFIPSTLFRTEVVSRSKYATYCPVDMFDFHGRASSWCERFIKTFQTR